MGISVAERQDGVGEGKKRSRIALLPEESLYLLERGSLQIWILADEPDLIHRPVGFGEWSDNLQGVVGAVEMSVMQGFASFLQQDSLTLQRYQVRYDCQPISGGPNFVPRRTHTSSDLALWSSELEQSSQRRCFSTATLNQSTAVLESSELCRLFDHGGSLSAPDFSNVLDRYGLAAFSWASRECGLGGRVRAHSLYWEAASSVIVARRPMVSPIYLH